MRHSEPIEPEAAVQFQQEGVSGKTPCRERVLPTQGLQAYRHTLRQIGPKLSRLDLSRSHHRLVDFMSLDPSGEDTTLRERRNRGSRNAGLLGGGWGTI